jgi:hypothetical protein
MNLNEYAFEISILESKKKSVNIAQIKEIIKVQNIILNRLPIWEFVCFMFKLRKNGADNRREE